MLRDRSAPVDLFALVPALQLHFEPELAELDRLREDDQIFQQVKADLSRRRPRTTETGRPSTAVEVILRLLVIQHLSGCLPWPPTSAFPSLGIVDGCGRISPASMLMIVVNS